MERSIEHEPQEVSAFGLLTTVSPLEVHTSCVPVREGDSQSESIAGAEESKSCALQALHDPAVEDKQPQSLVLQESPLVADRSSDECQLLRKYREFRALQSQLAHLRVENAELRRQLRDRGAAHAPEPAELKWLIYFRAPASKAQVLAVVREGLAALFAREPSFRGRECATFWAAQERSGWQAFRVDYVGHKLAAFRTAMKAAHAAARLPASEVRTT